MRTAEKERLAVLRAKVTSGQALNEKEQKRLQELEELEGKENNPNANNKETNVSGGRPSGGGQSESGSANSSGGGNTGGGEQVSSNGAGAKQGERTQRPLDAPGLGGKSGDNTIQSGGSSSVSGGETQSGGDSFGEYRGENPEQPSGSGNAANSKTVVHVQANSGLKPRPTKVDKKKQTTGNVTTPEDVYGAILQSGFSLIASTTGRRHWEIDKDEADSVAVPLSKMLDSMSSTNKKKLEKMMNPIMLGSAVAGIVIPRLMYDMSLMKGAKYHGQATAGNTRQTQSIGSGDVQSTIVVGNVESGRTTDSSTENAAPVVSAEIAGLFKDSNQSTTAGIDKV